MGYKHNKEDIVFKGSELIRKRGYNNVGINDILKECNIPKGSFYNFFKSKEEFGQRVIERYGRVSLNMIKRELHPDKGAPRQRLRNFYAMLIDAMEKEGYGGGCLIGNLSMEVGPLHEVLAKDLNDNFSMWVDFIAETVREGQEAGEIIDERDPVDLAEFLHAGLYGAYARMKVARDRQYLDKWLAMSMDYITKKN